MTTTIPFFQVDAFSARAFAGNPAAICPLSVWLPDSVMQAIAAENNLSETAFFVREGDVFRLRWFTPTTEVDLCGHATLASAFVLLTELEPGRTTVTFETRSGALTVREAVADEGLPANALVMDFPARPPTPMPASAEQRGRIAEALGAEPKDLWVARDLVAVFEDPNVVRTLRPDAALLAKLPHYAIAATAPGMGRDADVDFVSRFFAPKQGIFEDPVTGSAHCTLAPYWTERLQKSRLRARQVSQRGGDLTCTLKGDRVELAGQATLVIRGQLCFRSTSG